MDWGSLHGIRSAVLGVGSWSHSNFHLEYLTGSTDEHHYTFQALPGTAFQRQEYLESMNLVTETMILFLVDSSAKNYVFVHEVTQASLLTFKPSP